MRIFVRLSLTSLALSVGLACGSSDEPPSSAASGDAGAAGSGGVAMTGTGGAATAGGGAGMAGNATNAGSGGAATGGSGGDTAGGGAGGVSAGGAAGSTSTSYPPGPYGKAVDTIFPNLSWQGYANYTFDAVSTTKTFGPLSMDDIRKNGKKWALVTLSESYCPGCQKTAIQLKDAKAVVDAGAVIVDVLITTGFIDLPSKNDLDAWINKYDERVTVVMDPPGGGTVTRTTLGERENGFLIDLETMKIVETVKGSNTGAQPTVGELGLAKLKARLGLP